MQEHQSGKATSREIYIIGTSHQPINPEYARELESLLQYIDPHQILLEKEPIELEREQFKDDRPEMQFGYEWAVRRGISVKAYDHKNTILKNNITDTQLAQVNERMGEITSAYGWKELNHPDNVSAIESVLLSVLDMEKHHRRERRMLAAVKRKARQKGRIVILTGTYHLLFFRRQFPEAYFLEDIEDMRSSSSDSGKA